MIKTEYKNMYRYRIVKIGFADYQIERLWYHSTEYADIAGWQYVTFAWNKPLARLAVFLHKRKKPKRTVWEDK